MTKDEALKVADAVLALINSQPRTPTRDEIAEALEAETILCDLCSSFGAGPNAPKKRLVEVIERSERNWCLMHDQSVMECSCPQWPKK